MRSYEQAEIPLDPGVTAFIGANGQGKTNIVEAVEYAATFTSHRVSNDEPLIHAGAESAVIGVALNKSGREHRLQVSINSGKANQVQVDGHKYRRLRDALGTLRVVVFSPHDLAIIRENPGHRRRFLDEVLMARQPSWAQARLDYEKIVQQRNALLRSSSAYAQRSPSQNPALTTLPEWDEALIHTGAVLVHSRMHLVATMEKYFGRQYARLAGIKDTKKAHISYKSTIEEWLPSNNSLPELSAVKAAFQQALAQKQTQEIARGVTLIGPHRDDMEVTLGDLPARGYASHGESWSLALSAKLAAFSLLRTDIGSDPVLILDDVFAELDEKRRERLAESIADAEQTLITAAVSDDIPSCLDAHRIPVTLGQVGPDSADIPSEGEADDRTKA